MTGRVTLLEDTFEFQTVPFLVQVERREMFVNAETGGIRGINMHRAPTGMKKGGKEWVVCDVVFARVRPDYPYTIDKEWPENVDKHFHSAVLLEEPVKNSGWIFTSYSSQKTGKTVEDVDFQALAEKTIEKMKSAYENRVEVAELE